MSNLLIEYIFSDSLFNVSVGAECYILLHDISSIKRSSVNDFKVVFLSIMPKPTENGGKIDEFLIFNQFSTWPRVIINKREVLRMNEGPENKRRSWEWIKIKIPSVINSLPYTATFMQWLANINYSLLPQKIPFKLAIWTSGSTMFGRTPRCQYIHEILVYSTHNDHINRN